MGDESVGPTDAASRSERVSRNADPVTVLAVAKKTLDQLQVGQVRYFPEHVITEADWTRLIDEVRVMRVKMSSYVLAEKLAEDHYTRSTRFPFPSSPWQFFKERHQNSWWLSWLVQRKPVVYERHLFKVTVNVDRYLAYPQATIVDDRFGKPVQHEVVNIDLEEPGRVTG